ncbi:MAG: molybdenum ABC transporter ATP-binding protein [Acidobacteriota bacterium]
MRAGAGPGGLIFDLELRRGPFRLAVGLAVPRGVTVLFGPSGSGKSTLLQCLAGLIRPGSGRVELGERVLFSSVDRTHLPADRRRLGYVPQEGLLFPHLSLRENIFYGTVRASRSRPPDDGRRLDELIDALGLRALLDRRPAEVSRGEAQRAALLRALASYPEALLMDEPLSALDRDLKTRALADLKAIKRSLDIPVLYVTHDPAEVLALADRVALIRGGRIVAEGGPELAIDPRAAPGAGPIDNLISGRLRPPRPGRGGYDVSWGRFTLHVAGEAPPAGPEGGVGLAFGPNEAIVTLDPPGLTSARNVLQGTIAGVFVSEDRVLLRFDDPEPFYVAVTGEAREQLRLEAGARVFLLIKSTALRPVWSAPA